MSTARIFDEYYERYDSWYERHPGLAESEYLAAKKALGDYKHPCLEVGVGTGWFAHRLGCEVGVDPSIMMLSKARRRGVEAVAGRGEALPISSGRIPTVLMVVTICFVDDPLGVLMESARVLVDGGRLVACIVPRDSEWGRHYIELGRRGHPFYRHARFYTVEELLNIAYEAGLRLEGAVATITYPPGVGERVEGPVEYTGGEGFVCLRLVKA